MDSDNEWLSPEDPLYNEPRLCRRLKENGLEAVVVRSGQNVKYLSGMRIPGTLARHQDFAWSPRPVVVVWPLEGPPVLVANDINRDLASVSSWIEDVRTYTEYEDDPWEVCAEYLAELGIDDRRIGVEKREMTVDQWSAIEDSLPNCELIDCTGVMDTVRNVKTEGELELIQRSVDIQDETHTEVFAHATPGVTERELHAEMIGSMIRKGAEWGHGMMQSDNTEIIYGGEGPVRITDGDVVKTDYVSYLDGYAANLSRMAVMGRPSAPQKRKYRELLDVHRSIIDEELSPGVKASDVWSALESRLKQKGYTDVAGLAGHSTGVWWHQEQPILRPGDDTILEPGMVICLEPIIEKFWHVQDQILITEDGAEVLSDGFDTDSLFVLGG